MAAAGQLRSYFMSLPDQIQLNNIAAHLSTVREQLVEQWREAIGRDPEMTSSSHLSRGALDDSVRKILIGFERRVRADYSPRAVQVDQEQRANAAEHAEDRFEQGYDLRETLREWAHLQQVVLTEVERFAAQHPEAEPHTLAAARQILTSAFSESVTESATRHAKHLRSPPAGPNGGE
jgi:hypothetical protein